MNWIRYNIHDNKIRSVLVLKSVRFLSRALYSHYLYTISRMISNAHTVMHPVPACISTRTYVIDNQTIRHTVLARAAYTLVYHINIDPEKDKSEIN